MSAKSGVLHAYEHERICEILARAQELNARSSKHQYIRVNHWVKKLLGQPVSNPAWLKNVSEHASTLLQMLLDGVVDDPFLKMPPQGPLPTLPRHKVARFAGKTDPSRLGVRRTGRGIAPKASAQLLARLLHDEAEGDGERAPERKKVMHTKQIQTSDQDDQWEWQRVWKGAFEKMRSELLERTTQIQSMAAEMKELRALVAAQKHALEQGERIRDDAAAKHRAAVESVRAVHALELESLKAKHKKQLQDASLQNEKLLRDRRRENGEPVGGAAFNMQSESYGDFLAYIDDFYADTLKLTQTA